MSLRKKAHWASKQLTEFLRDFTQPNFAGIERIEELVAIVTEYTKARRKEWQQELDQAEY